MYKKIYFSKTDVYLSLDYIHRKISAKIITNKRINLFFLIKLADFTGRIKTFF